MGRAWVLLGVSFAALMLSAAASCGNSQSSQFSKHGMDGGLSFGDGGLSFGDGGLQFGDSGGIGTGESGIGTLSDGAPGCTGALCNVSMTDNCAGKNLPFTSITGVVYDPAGALPLYDVYVYIPGSTPDPIDPGNPACTPCEAPASGGPIIGTLTNEQGQFTLVQPNATSYGVPSGTSVPLVIQTGKWRKQITIPSVAACTTTAIPDPASPATSKLRLPANSSEGDMPIIAFTSGCDPAECFLRHVGISDSEFVPPTAPLPVAWTATGTPVAGAGHVRFYTGYDNTAGGGGGRGGGGGTPASASMVTGGEPVASTYTWWSSSANLLENDIVFNACECNPNDRGATAYAAMDTYLNGGGRVFATHFYYNWFEPSPPATNDLFSVASWRNPGLTPMNSATSTEADTIDQTFPKGAAFATWLQDNGITTTLGSITLGDVRDDVNGILPAGCEATGTCLSTQWIYTTTPAMGLNAGPRYISFNTPVAAPVISQCGRAVFSDVHLSGTSNNATFPMECTTNNPDPNGTHVTNEKALEFLFFDLSSCVQAESPDAGVAIPPPTQPPPK
jgi:hypothetical protein